MAFLNDRCARVPLTPKIVAACAPFTDEDNKTECRYLVVDAYNDDIPIEYYKRNGFDFMFSTEEQEKQYRNITNPDRLRTRLMFFDLMRITPAAPAAETA